jgi:hypothetical protein
MIHWANQKAANAFSWSVIVILCITSLSKLLPILTSSMPFFSEPDPIFGFLTIRMTLLVAAILELIVASVIFKSKSKVMAYSFILWLCIMFLLYRIGLIVTNYHRPCSCLGGIGKWLGVPDGVLSYISLGLLVYLFVGSLFFFIFRTVFSFSSSMPKC